MTAEHEMLPPCLAIGKCPDGFVRPGETPEALVRNSRMSVTCLEDYRLLAHFVEAGSLKRMCGIKQSGSIAFEYSNVVDQMNAEVAKRLADPDTPTDTRVRISTISIPERGRK